MMKSSSPVSFQELQEVDSRLEMQDLNIKQHRYSILSLAWSYLLWMAQIQPGACLAEGSSHGFCFQHIPQTRK